MSLLQSKLRKLLFVPSATLGTQSTFDGSSFILPAEDISLTRDRGTRIISRLGVMDGLAGEIKGCPGSWGSSLSFSCEIMDIDATDDPYWVQLLYCAGFEGDTSSPSNTIIPSTKPIVNYTSGSPAAGSFGLVGNADNHTADYILPMFDATGSVELSMVAGERALLNFTFVGRNDNGFIDLSDTDTSNLGTFPSTACPFIVKSITASLTDLASTDGLDTIGLSSLVITSNASTPDVSDPTNTDGMALSPVFWNEAPTVAFTVAATSLNNDYFFQSFKNGTGVSLQVVLTSAATGNTIVVTVPFIQYSDVTFEDTDGYLSYSITGKAVRNAGSTVSPITILWTYA